MKRAVLVLLILFPIGLAAQQENPSPVKNQLATSAAGQARWSTAGDEVASAETDSTADVAADAGSNAQQQPKANPSQPTPIPVETRPKIPGSMVGYIDNPIVVSSSKQARNEGALDPLALTLAGEAHLDELLDRRVEVADRQAVELWPGLPLGEDPEALLVEPSREDLLDRRVLGCVRGQ